MSDGQRGAADPRSTTSRRRLLTTGLGLAAAVVASGCTPSDPRIRSDGRLPSLPPTSASRTRSATPGPTLDPAWADHEQALADLAGGIASGPRRGELGAARRQLLTSVREAHLQHAAALRSPTPTARPLPPVASAAAPPLPSATARLSLDRSLRLLASAERSQSRRLRSAAVDAVGFEALLWGSMAVAADTYAGAVTAAKTPRLEVGRTAHPATDALSDVEALQAMVRQLHAIVYGYQLALGHLDQGSAAGRRALASLRAHRALRDRLEQLLHRRSASVPAAAGAYVPSVQPTSPARSGRLVRRMESALMPFCGLWLASATTSKDRTLALDTLTRTQSTAHAWGAPLTVWPGWQS